MDSGLRSEEHEELVIRTRHCFYSPRSPAPAQTDYEPLLRCSVNQERRHSKRLLVQMGLRRGRKKNEKDRGKYYYNNIILERSTPSHFSGRSKNHNFIHRYMTSDPSDFSC
jgi:hypothetical protein